MHKEINIDNNQNVLTIDTFRKEASLKSNIAEVTWIGYGKNKIKLCIHNLSKKTIPLNYYDFTLIDIDDNVYECDKIDSPPKGWGAPLVDYLVYSDMKAKVIMKVSDLEENTEIKRFIYNQRFYVGRGWSEVFTLFDFRLKQ